jgi:hypothetical protein
MLFFCTAHDAMIELVSGKKLLALGMQAIPGQPFTLRGQFYRNPKKAKMKSTTTMTPMM